MNMSRWLVTWPARCPGPLGVRLR